MGKNKKVKYPEKIIDGGSIEKRTVIKNTTVSSTILCWTVRKYSELENYLLYYQIYEGDNDFSCVFKLIKTPKTLHVAIRCGIGGMPSSFYLSNEHYMSSPFCVSKEITSGLYVGEFPQAMIYSPGGRFADTGLLTILFSFVPDVETTFVRDYEHLNLGELSDLDVLCHDVGQMYFGGSSSDFVINSDEGSFNVHKYVLFVRSELFREIFTAHHQPSEYTVNASAEIVHLVLLYCYSGTLPYMAKDCLVATLNVAKDLNIPSLVERCQTELDNYKKRSYSTDVSSGVSVAKGKVKDSLSFE